MSREKRLAGSSPLAGVRLSLRLARRTTLRGLRRSILIVALIAIPLAGTTAVLTVLQSTVPTTQELIATSLGETEAVLWAFAPPGSGLQQEPLEPFAAHTASGTPEGAKILDIHEVLPDGTEVLVLEFLSVQAETPHGRTRVEVLRGPSWSEAFTGMHHLDAGRAPSAADEVAVTRSVLERFEVDLGDQLTIAWPGEATVTVVGVMEDRTLPDSNLSLFAPSNTVIPSPQADGSTPLMTRYFLPVLALGWSDIQELNNQGYVALSRDVLLSPPLHAQPPFKQSSVQAILVAGSIVGVVFAALEVILLAGAAFSVTARQEQRTLALLASTGASPRRLRGLLAGRGLLLGLLGGLTGVGLGIIIAAGFISWDSNGSATQYYGFHVPLVYSILFAVVAAVLGWLAALVPGRAIARMDVVGALRGSRRPHAPSVHTPRFGLALIIMGAVVLAGVAVAVPFLYDAYYRGVLTQRTQLPYTEGTLIAAGGALLLLLGLALTVSFLLGRLASGSRNAPLTTRLALREASRNSSRTTPAVAVTLVVTFVASLGMSMLGAMQAQLMSGYLQTARTGTVYISLTQNVHSDDGTLESRHFSDVTPIRKILEGNVDLAAMSMIWSTEPWNPLASVESDSDSDAPKTSFVAVDIPPAQLCPSDPRSPEWTPEHEVTGTAAYASWRTDARCVRESRTIVGVGEVQVTNETGLALILGHEPSGPTVEAFRSGKAVVLDESLMHDGSVSLSWWGHSGGRPPYSVPEGVTAIRTEIVGAHAVDTGYDGGFSVVVSRSTAQQLGLDINPAVVLASTHTPVRDEQLIALQDSALTVTGAAPGQLSPQVERGPSSRLNEQAVALALIVSLSAIIALAATAIAIGLARVDSARDVLTLRAVGASPSLQRGLSFAQAFIIAGTGTALGTLLGIAPAAVIGTVLEMPFSPPWTHLALLLAGVPLIIATGNALIGRRVRGAQLRL